MVDTTLIQVRIDKTLKAKASRIYEDLGIDLSTAVRMFLRRSVAENGIPFSMILPKENNESDTDSINSSSRDE